MGQWALVGQQNSCGYRRICHDSNHTSTRSSQGELFGIRFMIILALALCKTFQIRDCSKPRSIVKKHLKTGSETPILGSYQAGWLGVFMCNTLCPEGFVFR